MVQRLLFGSGGDHCDLELAVEVRRQKLRLFVSGEDQFAPEPGCPGFFSRFAGFQRRCVDKTGIRSDRGCMYHQKFYVFVFFCMLAFYFLIFFISTYSLPIVSVFLFHFFGSFSFSCVSFGV